MIFPRFSLIFDNVPPNNVGTNNKTAIKCIIFVYFVHPYIYNIFAKPTRNTHIRQIIHTTPILLILDYIIYTIFIEDLKTNMKLIITILLSLIGISSAFAQSPKFYLKKVENKIQIGQLAGNRNLEFGVTNIFEELLSENYTLVPKAESADYTVQAEIVFLDVEQSNVSVGLLHQDKQSVVISMTGKLLKGEKTIKKAVATEKSSEVSMSTLVISEAGGFNQQSLSNALKKAAVSLTTKLLDKI